MAHANPKHRFDEAHTEQARFEIRLELEADFPPGYEGDMDGYAWRRHFEERIRRELLTAVAATLRRQPGWELVPTSRGHSPERVAEFRYRYAGSGLPEGNGSA